MNTSLMAVSESGLAAQRYGYSLCGGYYLIQFRVLPPDHSPIQPITSPRAREESMPDLGEFAALFVVLFLTMYW